MNITNNNSINVSISNSNKVESDIFEWSTKTQIGKQLRAMEESLLCHICNDFAENPHSLQCGHSFCSMCIRKHFDRKINSVTYQQCPSCREKSELSQLRSNKALGLAIDCFMAVRKGLLELTKDSQSKLLLEPSSSSSSSTMLTTSADNWKRLVHKDFHKWPKDKIKKELIAVCAGSKECLLLDGSAEDLERRYRELVHLNNSQMNSLHPLSFSACIKEINKLEHARLSECKSAMYTAQRVEKLRNGVIPKKAEDGFLALAKSIRESKRKLKQSEESLSESKQQLSSQSQSDAIIVNSFYYSATEVIGSADGKEETEDIASRPESELDGIFPWRVIYSNVAKRPFYFNELTGIGQFEPPPGISLDLVQLPQSQSPLQSQTVVQDQEAVKSQLSQTSSNSVEAEVEHGILSTTTPRANRRSRRESKTVVFASELSPVIVLDNQPAGGVVPNYSQSNVVDQSIELQDKVEISRSPGQRSEDDGSSSLAEQRMESASPRDSQESLLDLGCDDVQRMDSNFENSDDLAVLEGDSDEGVELISASSTMFEARRWIDRQQCQDDIPSQLSTTKRGVKRSSTMPSFSSQSTVFGSATRGSSPSMVEWSCDLCTFINKAHLKQCEMCGTTNPNVQTNSKQGQSSLDTCFGANSSSRNNSKSQPKVSDRTPRRVNSTASVMSSRSTSSTKKQKY